MLRERSLWTDNKGRTLLVWNRWFQGVGADLRCSEVDLLILGDTANRAPALVRRPWKQLATYIEDGKMIYAGEVPAIVENPA